jgi:hypothetical protein
MLPCREFIAHSIKMRRSIGRLSASVLSHPSLSSVVFITNIAESDFRHTQGEHLRLRPLSSQGQVLIRIPHNASSRAMSTKNLSAALADKGYAGPRNPYRQLIPSCRCPWAESAVAAAAGPLVGLALSVGRHDLHDGWEPPRSPQ